METKEKAIDHLYFYATDDVRFYDPTAEATDRAYQLMQTCAVELLSRWLGARGNNSDMTPSWIIDLGCGTGAATMLLLSMIPNCNIICLDKSPDMLAQLRQKVENAYGENSAGGRVVYACQDFCASNWLDACISRLDQASRPNGINAVISIYALHHLYPAEKQSLYRDIRRSLRSGGLFVLGDLFGFGSQWLSLWAQECEESWLMQEFDNMPREKPWLAAALGPHRLRLMEAWLKHLRNDNRPLAIQAAGNSCSEQSQSEAELLARAGFVCAETAFRMWQSAILIANV